jgi:hypothetical protein
MTAKSKRVRCAVYTRVSTEYGLDQEFNSLDAQHEASEAYIRSQSHDGWTPVRPVPRRSTASPHGRPQAVAQGTTSPRPTSMRAAVKVPSGCLVAAAAATAAPDFSSLLSENSLRFRGDRFEAAGARGGVAMAVREKSLEHRASRARVSSRRSTGAVRTDRCGAGTGRTGRISDLIERLWKYRVVRGRARSQSRHMIQTFFIPQLFAEAQYPTTFHRFESCQWRDRFESDTAPPSTSTQAKST